MKFHSGDIIGHREEWRLWIGNELEGRFHGLSTLFVGAGAKDEEIEEWRFEVPHIFFTEAYLRQEGYRVPPKYSQRNLVTLEIGIDMLKAIPTALRHECHLMLKIELPEGDNLTNYVKDTDTVRLDIEPYRTLTVSVRAFQRTSPEQYMTDRRLDKPDRPRLLPARSLGLQSKR